MLEELLVFLFVPFFLAAKRVMGPKLFPQLTDIIGSHVYGRENSLLEQSVIHLNSLPRQHTGDAMAQELSGDIPYHTLIHPG